jgi:hypothetical protein
MAQGSYPFLYDSQPTHTQAISKDSIDAPLIQVQFATTLAVEAAVDALTIEVQPGHGFVTGSYIVISAGPTAGQIYLGTVLSVAVNVLTLDTPINFAYEVGSTVLRATRALNVDGSVTAQTFEIGPPDGQDWEITRFMFTMLCDTQPDDSKFGDLASLTRGIVLRRKRNGNDRYNLINVKNQFDFASYAYDVTYSDNAGPQSEYGVRSRLSYGGDDKHNGSIVLEGMTNDVIQCIVQDDLTGLVDFKIIVEGNVLFEE